MLGRLLEKESARETANAEERWHRWITKALEKGAAIAHKWTNLPNAKVPQIQVSGLTSPQGIVENQRDYWAKVLQSHRTDKVEEVDKQLHAMRLSLIGAGGSSHRAEILSSLTAGNVRNAARSFKSRTSIGCDATSFKEIAEASDEALEELACMFCEAVVNVALPMQVLLNMVALLGKKNGGSRCIAICATFYRLLLGVLKPLAREWDLKHGNKHDSALTGRFPLVETAKRATVMEDASLRGKATSWCCGT